MIDFDPGSLLTESEKQKGEDWVRGFVVGYLADDRICSPSNAVQFADCFYEGRRRKHDHQDRSR